MPQGTRYSLSTAIGAVSPEAEALTALDWPSNGEGSVQFKFKGTALPNITPLTMLWKVRPKQQTGYYTTFFWSDDQTDFINDVKDDPYFGCHPYPDGGASGTTHNWEISIQGFDDIDDENANDTTVIQNQWVSQASVSVIATGELEVDFYWNIAAGIDRHIHYRSTDSWGDGTGWTDPSLTFGDAPWSLDNEQMSAAFRGLIIVEAALSTTHIEALADFDTDAEVISYCSANSIVLFYVNMNPTPSDISDKSELNGTDHDPAWVGSNRPDPLTL